MDRLIGGRIWIVLIGTLLVGIVTMQLTLLRLNAGIGRAVEHSAALEQSNATLHTSISRLSDSQRIVALATQMGLVTPPQGSPRFLTASAADAGKALTTMRVPSATPPASTTAVATDTTATGVTTTDPAATTVDPAATDPAATDPAATTPVDPAATTTLTTDATAPTTPAGTTATPATPLAAAPTPVATAGGAAPPVGGQG